MSQKILWLSLLLPIVLLYLYRVVVSYPFDSDFGRDLYDMLSITQGDLRLLGPKLSFGGIHTGPYYYYLFAPLLIVWPDHPEVIVIANAVLAWFAILIIFWLFVRVWRAPKICALLGVYFIATIPAILFSARQPGNAFTHQPFTLILFLLLPWLLKQKKSILWLVYGLGVGAVLNFHLIGAVVFAPFLLVTLLSQFKKGIKSVLAKGIFLILGVVLSFAPLILFELTHDFVQLKNTFIDKSYLAFTTNSNLPSPMPTSHNLVKNYQLVQAYISDWLGIPFWLLLTIILSLSVWQWKKLQLVDKVMVISLPISTVLFVLLARSQLAVHYLFPIVLFTSLVFVLILSRIVTRVSYALLLLFWFNNLYQLPNTWYAPAQRSISEFRQFTTNLLESELAQYLQPNQFSIFVTRETSLAPLGWEYRYYLLTHNISQPDPSLFGQPPYLVWIAENPNTDYHTTQSWELNQFGARQLLASQTIDGREISVYEKQN